MQVEDRPGVPYHTQNRHLDVGDLFIYLILIISETFVRLTPYQIKEILKKGQY